MNPAFATTSVINLNHFLSPHLKPLITVLLWCADCIDSTTVVTSRAGAAVRDQIRLTTYFAPSAMEDQGTLLAACAYDNPVALLFPYRLRRSLDFGRAFELTGTSA